MRILVICFALLIVCSISGAALASASYLSFTGNILTPNDNVLGPGDFSADYHAFDLTHSARSMGVAIGVTETLELGVARFDSDAPGADIQTVISGKYALLRESISMPAVTVGVVDALGDLDPDGDPGLFIVVGKNLTPAATGLAGEPLPPIRGYAGFGTGIYEGFFVGADMSFSERGKIIAEYISKIKVKDAIDNKSLFNVGARLSLTNELSGDIALINVEDLAFGISYTKLAF